MIFLPTVTLMSAASCAKSWVQFSNKKNTGSDFLPFLQMIAILLNKAIEYITVL
jgi:hypothetical protein